MKAILLQRLDEARALSDDLFAIVRPEAIYDRPIPERHRIIFYLGHLEAFDWNLLNDRLFDLPQFSPAFNTLFAFGIDPVDGGLPTDQPKDWPTRTKVEEYQRTCAIPWTSSWRPWTGPLDGAGEAVQLLHVAIEHRLMHVETLSYMLHQLPTDRKYHSQDRPSPATQPGPARMIEIPGKSTATLGLRRAEDGALSAGITNSRNTA